MARRKLPAEPFELDIERLLPNGRGAGQVGEKTLQVHGALAGESVQARYLFGRKFKGQAETLEVLKPAAERVVPACSHFGTCSACVLQHMSASAQLAFKQRVVMDLFDQFGHIAPETEQAPLAAEPWHYRRKARLSVRYVDKKQRLLLGFRERDGRFVTDMQECHILPRPLMAHLPALREALETLDAARTIPQIEVSCGDEDTALVIRHLEPLSDSDHAALCRYQQQSGLRLWLQSKGPDTVVDMEGRTPAQAPELSYALPEHDLRYQFQPLDFVQVNGALNSLMIEQAINWLELSEQDRVLDLFCGLGNFSLPMARRVNQVLGVEGDAGLVRRAEENAQRNGIKNARFLAADLYGEPDGQSWAKSAYNKVLLDPPRSGAAQILPLIAASEAERICYVSCNPETLARDAQLLVQQHGFRLHSAGIMDMFPHTAHVETMALFER